MNLSDHIQWLNDQVEGIVDDVDQQFTLPKDRRRMLRVIADELMDRSDRSLPKDPTEWLDALMDGRV